MDLSASESGSEEDVTGETGLLVKQPRGKPHASSKSDCQGGPKAEMKEWSHNLHVSQATIHHMEAVFSMVRKIYGQQPGNAM